MHLNMMEHRAAAGSESDQMGAMVAIGAPTIEPQTTLNGNNDPTIMDTTTSLGQSGYNHALVDLPPTSTPPAQLQLMSAAEQQLHNPQLAMTQVDAHKTITGGMNGYPPNSGIAGASMLPVQSSSSVSNYPQHGYAGFGGGGDQSSSKVSVDKPLSINTAVGTNARPGRRGPRDREDTRYLSPIPTDHRKAAIELQEEKMERRKRSRVDGVAGMLAFIRGDTENESINFVVEVTPPPSPSAHTAVHEWYDYHRQQQQQPGIPIQFESIADAHQQPTTSGAQAFQIDTATARVLPQTSAFNNNNINAATTSDIMTADQIMCTAEIKKRMRAKMIRCKRCKNRFVERVLYEKHLQAKHHDDYIVYMAQQEMEMELQRREELEQMRHEEISCGGFIPPASAVESSGFADFEINNIPLPGEGFGGIAPRFDRFGALRMPKRAYKKKVSPQCPFCDKRFRNENSLKKHISKKHPESMHFVQCNNCYKSLSSAALLPQDKHLCELKHICFECNPIRNLCTENRLANHKAKFHRGAQSGFKCNDCNRKFLTPRKLRKHKKMAHVVDKPYKCHFCDDVFPTETQVSLHERIHTGKVRYECNICDFRANRHPKLDRHKREEHGYVCCICHEKMTEWNDLKMHTLDKHGGYLTHEKGARYVESPRVWILFKGE